MDDHDNPAHAFSFLISDTAIRLGIFHLLLNMISSGSRDLAQQLREIVPRGKTSDEFTCVQHYIIQGSGSRCHIEKYDLETRLHLVEGPNQV